MFERNKSYVFKRVLFVEDMMNVYCATCVQDVRWAQEIDDYLVIPLSDDEGYCGDYYVVREWCQELEEEDM